MGSCKCKVVVVRDLHGVCLLMREMFVWRLRAELNCGVTLGTAVIQFEYHSAVIFILISCSYI
jgi:hypothetical protein